MPRESTIGSCLRFQLVLPIDSVNGVELRRVESTRSFEYLLIQLIGDVLIQLIGYVDYSTANPQPLGKRGSKWFR